MIESLSGVRATEAGPVAPAYAFPGQRKPPVARTPESRKSVVAALNAVHKAVSAVQNTDAL